jgi:predicted RNA methylase
MKKYALHNSYFKARYGDMPDTILEIAKYYKEKGELPFKYMGSNWVYDAFCERQKRKGVYNSQFLTPDATVARMMHFVDKYFTESLVLEPCCGTGQITKELIQSGYSVSAFDIDDELVELCKLLYPNTIVGQADFRDFTGKRNQIIANPPYELSELTAFLEWILSVQSSGGTSVLLLPKGFVQKERPKALVSILQQFFVLETEDMRENFERTGTRAEIVVLRKK